MTIKSTITAIACLSFFTFAALPEMRITTKNSAEPQSKNGGTCQGAWTNSGMSTHIFDYIAVTNFQLTGSAADLTKTPALNDSIYIRLRGNSTADAAKKPYRIKFDKKVSLIDKNKEPAKSWALLANFYDGTFALNAMAFEMGKKMGLDFTNSSQLVDLYINNQYKGIYQLTEQIQSNKRSVDLRDKHNGWLVEFDYHAPASDECLRAYVVDKNGYNITSFIKAPELDDMDNPKDSTQLRFVKNDLKKLIDKMKESSFPNNGYRDLIDLESFAKYVLIQLVLDNFDFNSKTQAGGLPGSNFLYRIDDCSKIQAGPLWDFDLAAGVQNNGGGGGGFGGWPGMPGQGGGAAGFPSHYQSYQDPVAPTSQNYSHIFYRRLWEDPVFKAKYKKLWDKHKSDFQSMGTYIDNIKSQVSGSVTGKGNNTWANNSMMGGTLTQQQFDTEVSGFKTWLNNRINYVEQELRNIDTSKDIAESSLVCEDEKTPQQPQLPSPIKLQIAGINGILAIKNGVNLQVQKSASLDIYTLSGKLQKSLNFGSGVYNVPLGDLPKGMYIAKVSFGDGVKVLRVPVM